MAVDVSERVPDNAEQLRRRANRRLLGASTLLLIAIIAVPMFLEREPPPLPDNVDVRIPPVEGSKFEPKFPEGKKAASEKPAEIATITEPVGAQAATPAQGSADSAAVIAPPLAVERTPAVAVQAAAAPEKKAQPATVDKPAPAKETPKTVDKPSEKASVKAADKSATDGARTPGRLVVQVIAVRDPATAKQFYDKAKALKFPAYTEKIDVSNGVVTRVRVGPYDSKQQAESARARLVQAGFEAKVVTLQ